MTILAIETSCDETSVAVVQDGWKVLSNVIGSQTDIHTLTGGVVPEVAAREHVRAIVPIVDEALRVAYGSSDSLVPIKNPKSQILNPKQIQNSKSKIQNSPADRCWQFIDRIAVTTEPGLVTSLLVGTETAKFLGYVWDKPVTSVNHVHGHVAANWLDRDPATDLIEFPVMCLSVSGGHNELILLRSKEEWEVVGETVDDAAGEAFDKVARVLGLGYPGGPAIEACALKFRAESSEFREEIFFPRAWMSENSRPGWDRKSLNFSFSGLKSEVLREVERRVSRESGVGSREKKRVEECDQIEIAYAFQEAVCDVLSEKLVEAVRRYGAKEVHLAGGVSANKRLREMVREKLDREGMKQVFRFPKSIKYCTDNAAMIGAAVFWKV